MGNLLTCQVATQRPKKDLSCRPTFVLLLLSCVSTSSSRSNIPLQSADDRPQNVTSNYLSRSYVPLQSSEPLTGCTVAGMVYCVDLDLLFGGVGGYISGSLCQRLYNCFDPNLCGIISAEEPEKLNSKCEFFYVVQCLRTWLAIQPGLIRSQWLIKSTP